MSQNHLTEHKTLETNGTSLTLETISKEAQKILNQFSNSKNNPNHDDFLKTLTHTSFLQYVTNYTKDEFSTLFNHKKAGAFLMYHFFKSHKKSILKLSKQKKVTIGKRRDWSDLDIKDTKSEFKLNGWYRLELNNKGWSYVTRVTKNALEFRICQANQLGAVLKTDKSHWVAYNKGQWGKKVNGPHELSRIQVLWW